MLAFATRCRGPDASFATEPSLGVLPKPTDGGAGLPCRAASGASELRSADVQASAAPGLSRLGRRMRTGARACADMSGRDRSSTAAVRTETARSEPACSPRQEHPRVADPLRGRRKVPYSSDRRDVRPASTQPRRLAIPPPTGTKARARPLRPLYVHHHHLRHWHPLRALAPNKNPACAGLLEWAVEDSNLQPWD